MNAKEEQLLTEKKMLTAENQSVKHAGRGDRKLGTLKDQAYR